MAPNNGDQNATIGAVALLYLARFGAPGLLAAVGLGLAIWGLSQFAAQPGTPVTVLWGLTSYTKAGPTSKSSQCQNIAGRWNRSIDNFSLTLTQDGCHVTGQSTSDNEADSNQYNITVAGNSGTGFIRRAYKGCTTYLAITITLESSSALRIVGYGKGCDLVQLYKEDYSYDRLAD